MYRFQHLVLRGLIAFGFFSVALFAFAAATLGQGTAINKIYVVQVLGNQSDLYVAGKDTAVLVILNDAVAVNSATQQVVVSRDGATVATLEPAASAEPTKLLTFNCPSRAACGDWKAGDYTFQVKVGDSTAKATAKFQERKKIRVLALPVKTNYGPGDVREVTGSWKTEGEFTRKVYPIAPENFDWILGQDLDASADKYNVQTEEGQFEVWKAIALMQSEACYQKPRPTDVNCYDQIYGFIRDPIKLPEGILLGFTRGHGINVGAEQTPQGDSAATVAHEIGHNYKLGDEYDSGQYNCTVNPPPSTYVGRDFTNPQMSNFSCTDSKALLPPGGSSSMVALDAIPFEVGGRGLLAIPLLSFMGNGAPMTNYWITPDAWKQIFGQLAPEQKTSALRMAMPAKATPARWIFALGEIGIDGKVQVEPWWSFSDTHEHKDSTGTQYTLRAVDAQGNALASEALDVQFIIPDQAPLTVAPFEAALPFPEKTTAFQVVSGTQVLKEIKVSANAPEVKVTAPTASDKLDAGAVTIKWTGSDKDGDTLTYIVEYSADGQNWIPLAVDLEKTEWTEDFSGLPGTGKATTKIKVTATDGINSTEAESELLTVSAKAPEVFIEEPDNNEIFAQGEEVSLGGEAYDLMEEWIEQDDALVWGSDLQGEIGKGAQVYVDDLKLGTHNITLKATNSLGLTGVMTVTITIVEPGKAPTPTPVPAIPTSAPTPTKTPTASSMTEPAIAGGARLPLLIGSLVGVNAVGGIAWLTRRLRKRS